MFTTVDLRKLQDRLDEITNKTEVIESEEVANLEEIGGYIGQQTDPIMFKGKEIDVDKLDYDMQDISDGIYELNAPVMYTDGTELSPEDMDALYDIPELNDYIYQDYMDRVAPQEAVDEASPEEVTNTGREEDEATRAGKIDRLSVTGSDVAPVAEQLRAEYAKDADEWNARYAELENQAKKEKPGITGTDLMQAVFDYDDDIVGYVNIDDLEDKIEAMDKIIKDPNMDGDDIVSVLEYSISDTSPREELMQDFKIGVKNMSPEIYSKLFMYDVDESKGATESIAQEGDAELDELKGMLGRSGVMGFTN